MSTTVHLPRPAYSASNDYSRLALFADVASSIPSTANKAHGYRAIREDAESPALLISPSFTVIGHRGEYTREQAQALYDLAALVTYNDAMKAQSAMAVAESVAETWEVTGDEAAPVLLIADRAIRSGLAGLSKPESLVKRLTDESAESLTDAIGALEDALKDANKAANARKKNGGKRERKPADVLEGANKAMQALLDAMTAESDPFVPTAEGLAELQSKVEALRVLITGGLKKTA